MPLFRKKSIRKKVISAPSNFSHISHVSFDSVSGRFRDLPAGWNDILGETEDQRYPESKTSKSKKNTGTENDTFETTKTTKQETSAMDEALESTQWRRKGNDVYRSVTDGLCPALKRDRLNLALHHYSRANELARTSVEKSSACKNIALAAWKMAPVAKDRKDKPQTIHFYYKEALKYFREAHASSDVQSLEWVSGVMTSAIVCWTEFLETLDSVDVETRIGEVQGSVQFVLDRLTRAQAHLEVTNHFFHAGVTELQKRNYKKSLSMLKDCYFPLNEARRLGTSCSSLMADVEVLEADIHVQMCVTQSIKARVTGETLLNHVIREEEDLNIDMVWEVIDWYRTAIQLTREKDMEMEAIAHCRLGQVYEQVLRMKKKARENFHRAVELANLMVPRNFSSEDWYIAATSALQHYQSETVQAEEKAKQEEKEKVKEEIKDDLKKLEEEFKKSTKIEFLVFLYKTYEPKNPMYKKTDFPEKPAMDEWKKLYCKAVVHYHPDKVDVEEHGLKWKVLSEEITKLLTQHYETLKGQT